MKYFIFFIVNIFLLRLILLGAISQQNNDKNYKFYILPLIITGYPDNLPNTNFTISDLIKIIKNLQKIKYQTNIQIGSNKQYLKTDINLNNHGLYVSSNKISENIIIPSFNQNLSFTYQKLSDETYNEDNNQICSLCIDSKDNFYIQNKTITGLNFILGTELKPSYNETSAEIGLRLSSSPDDFESNLLIQLKEKGFTSEYSFRFRFSNNLNYSNFYKEGELIIGAYPHQYLDNIYAEKNLNTFYVGNPFQTPSNWDFTVKSIMLGRYIVSLTRLIKLNIESSFIKGGYIFLEEITNKFFKNYFSNGICANLTDNNDIYIYCNQSANLSNMDELIFSVYDSQSNFEIVFNYEDLFYKCGEYYLFLIMFSKNYYDWSIGNLFLYKFQPIFDMDKKIIGIYDHLFIEEEDSFSRSIDIDNNEDEKNKEDDAGKNINNYYLLLFLISVFVLIVVVGSFIFFVLKIMKNKKKKRANELLDDDYIYEPNSNKDEIINENFNNDI